MPSFDAETIRSLVLRAGLPPTAERLAALGAAAPIAGRILATLASRETVSPQVEPALVFHAAAMEAEGK